MKKRPVPQDDFFDGFFKWLDSDKGETSMEAMEAVAAAFQGADLDIKERRIVWPDGKRLTIDESAEKIQKQTGTDLQSITSHIVGWLEMGFEKDEDDHESPIGFDDDAEVINACLRMAGRDDLCVDPEECEGAV